MKFLVDTLMTPYDTDRPTKLQVMYWKDHQLTDIMEEQRKVVGTVKQLELIACEDLNGNEFIHYFAKCVGVLSSGAIFDNPTNRSIADRRVPTLPEYRSQYIGDAGRGPAIGRCNFHRGMHMRVATCVNWALPPAPLDPDWRTVVANAPVPPSPSYNWIDEPRRDASTFPDDWKVQRDEPIDSLMRSIGQGKDKPKIELPGVKFVTGSRGGGKTQEMYDTLTSKAHQFHASLCLVCKRIRHERDALRKKVYELTELTKQKHEPTPPSDPVKWMEGCFTKGCTHYGQHQYNADCELMECKLIGTLHPMFSLEPVNQWSVEAQKALDELVNARNNYHERHGVPISFEYARFLEAIGQVQDMLKRTVT